MPKCPCPKCGAPLVVNGYYQVAYCPNDQCGVYLCLIHDCAYASILVECVPCKSARLATEARLEKENEQERAHVA